MPAATAIVAFVVLSLVLGPVIGIAAGLVVLAVGMAVARRRQANRLARSGGPWTDPYTK